MLEVEIAHSESLDGTWESPFLRKRGLVFHEYIVYSVLDYKTMAVSAVFEANGLARCDAGLLSVQRDGAISDSQCAARGSCKNWSKPGEWLLGRMGVMVQFVEVN